ncbi:hypothetical protein EJ05DRAFT_539765 [Pseudovirgaria hyperparasitica]|uniref:Uncharacterized protein n=1 Tax=Pseudovirgaria hyperparasitica TaxID=470096 RepID=A0A6A6W1V6_9PEZI|nr:uncharacterized protein EJ05DRAFT_539765 [Pseudovirgaria hyperparasitica]KAF2755920.1 hypothetical protein EJ05DRAFT_539765 [Pseudovirgaria hyperparasitica]
MLRHALLTGAGSPICWLHLQLSALAEIDVAVAIASQVEHSYPSQDTFRCGDHHSSYSQGSYALPESECYVHPLYPALNHTARTVLCYGALVLSDIVIYVHTGAVPFGGFYHVMWLTETPIHVGGRSAVETKSWLLCKTPGGPANQEPRRSVFSGVEQRLETQH